MSRHLTATSTLVTALVLVLATCDDGFAQGGPRWRGSGGWGPGGPYMRAYDAKAVETVKGEVVKIDRITPMRGMAAGMHIVLKTEKEEISVHLGPEWFVLNQDVKIAPGDALEVKGARATFQGKPALIAAEVRKGADVLKLRDDAGVPVWAGWRRG
jgi:hypothetical protein